MAGLRSTFFLFGLALCAGCGGSAPAPVPVTPGGARLPANIRGLSGSSKLSHVIVIVQENRSLENFFAGYPGANAPMTGCALPSSPAAQRVALQRRYRRASSSGCPPSDVSVPLAQTTFQTSADLRHDWFSSMTDWDNGNMDGFSKFGKPGLYRAYTYVEQSQITPYWSMAQQYVLADEMFPTEFGGSFTSHLMLVAGNDDIQLPGEAEVDFPNHKPDDCDSPKGTKTSYLTQYPYRLKHYLTGPFPCFDQFNTMAQVLDGAGVSWKYYATRVLKGGFWEPFEAIKYVRYGNDWSTDIVAPQSQVLHDAMYGTLSGVSWVEPTRVDSDHPEAHSDTGPSWVASIVNAVGESAYWPTTAIIVVWDDWGGFYDNAAPPQLDYRGLGIRVPCLIISPYAKQGYVSHVQYEYGSILRFIEEVYGLPAGAIGYTSSGYTDGRATSLDDAFDFNQNPRPFYPIGSKYPMSHFLHEPPSTGLLDSE